MFWVHAANVGRFEQDYRAIAKAFQLPGEDTAQSNTLQLVYDWLENQYKQKWLMIIDNVDGNQLFEATTSGKICREYIPQRTSNGKILYTSRSRDVCYQLVDDPINIPSMAANEARLLLGDRLTSTSNESEIHELLDELEYLPLAIMQASKYMSARRRSLFQYLEQFRESKKSRIGLLTHKFSDVNRRERGLESVAATWMISFDHIRQECPRASDLLSLMSFLDRQGIPRSLVIKTGENSVEFDNAIAMLEAYSLISTDDTNNLYTLHRLVQVVTNAWIVSLNEGEEFKWAFCALEKLSKGFLNGDDSDNWPLCALYLPHVETVLDQQSLHHQQPLNDRYQISKAVLLKHASRFMSYQGHDLQRAMRYAYQSLEIYEHQSLGSCSGALLAKYEMADLHAFGEEFDKAERLFRQVHEGLDAQLGRNDPNTLLAAEGLAWTLILLHKNQAEAESLSWRAVLGHETRFGKNHQKSLKSRNIYALVQQSLGNPEEAEKIHRDVLRMQELKFGKLHPETIQSTCNLGILLGNNEQYFESEKIGRQAVESPMILYGAENGHTLWCIQNWIWLLRKLGNLDESEAICRDTLAIAEDNLGFTHRLTISIAEELGYVLRDKGEPFEAEYILRDAIRRGEVRWGATDYHILECRGYLAEVLDMQGRRLEAEMMLGEVLEQIVGSVGPDHDDVVWIKRLQREARTGRERQEKAAAPIWSIFSSEEPSWIERLWIQ